MTDEQTAVQTQSDSNESLGELLRTRAMASSPRLLIGQAIAGVGLNAAVLVWHPERWGIATAAAATIALQALWSIAVQRTTAERESLGRYDDEHELPGHAGQSDGPDDGEFTAATREELSDGVPLREQRRWWHVRRAAAVGASAAALTLLWFVCMMLLGRLMT